MCGIVGIYSFKQNTLSRKPYINWCLETMKHRGPDSNGIWQHENYITGFVRLAIRDVSESGSQPMVSKCGNYCITFNGEIYNAENYKEQLLQKGVVFKSTSDTEILLYAIIHFGLDFVLQNFDGMYAFAFYDSTLNEVVIARDRLGIKPLYIGFNKNEDIIFSSQYDHIINYEFLSKEPIDASVIASYLQLGFVADGFGLINNTQLLPHGHYIKINKSGFEIKEYKKILHSSEVLNNFLSETDIFNSVQSQLISDVPLGTFMSGGVDSSLVTLLANKGKKVTAYTISTGEAITDEKEKAEWFANKFKIPHLIKIIDKQDIEEMVSKHSKAYTEPFADFSSLPSLLISKVAQQHVKVVLSGDGPDELFFGYQRNIRMINLIRKFYRLRWINLVDYLLSKLFILPKTISKQFLKAKSFADFYYNSMFIYGSAIWANKIFPVKPKEAFFSKKIKEYVVNENSLDIAMYTIWNYEMNIHLQRILLKMDRASMFQSLEARVPYLSNNIIDKASTISWRNCIYGSNGKNNVKKILSEYTGDDFVYTQKKGFDIPMNSWINGPLKKIITETIYTMPDELKQYFNTSQIDLMLKNQFDNKEKNGNMIWAVFTLINWYNDHRHSYKQEVV